MEQFLQNHKEIPFAWVLWLPMIGLWSQAALSALALGRRRRGKRAPKAEARFDATCPPRLMAPR